MTIVGWVPDPAHDFGARLALVRQHEGWNIREAARECGLDPESWRAWETQGRKPRDFAAACQKVSERAGCSVIWLMTGQSPAPGGSGVEWAPRGSNPQPTVSGSGLLELVRPAA